MEKPLVLLVEDNPDDEELTLFAFRKAEILCDIKVVHDGAEAISYIESCRTDGYGKLFPSLMVLDLKLPKYDGFDVLKRLREKDVTRYVPVVILTSSKESEDIVRGYKYGANSYVSKPIDFSDFCNVIRNMAYYWLFINEKYHV